MVFLQFSGSFRFSFLFSFTYLWGPFVFVTQELAHISPATTTCPPLPPPPVFTLCSSLRGPGRTQTLKFSAAALEHNYKPTCSTSSKPYPLLYSCVQSY